MGGVHKKLIQRGGLPKKGRLGQFADLRGEGGGEGAWQERGCFEEEVDTPMHTMNIPCIFLFYLIIYLFIYLFIILLVEFASIT